MEQKRRSALLDLILINKEEMIRNLKGRAALAGSQDGEFQEHERMEQGRKQDHRPRLQKSRQRDPLGRVSQVMAL